MTIRHRIWLCDPDEDFMSRVAGYVRESRWRMAIEIGTFREAERLAEHADRENPSLIVMNEIYRARVSDKWTEKFSILWMGEKREEAEGARVFKFQPMPALIQHWLNCLEESGVRQEEIRRIPIISIWSASGGTGKTTIASYLAAAWCRSGSSPFYLSFHPEPEVRLPAEHIVQYDLGEWLYNIKSGKPVKRGIIDSPTAIHCFNRDAPLPEYIHIRKKEALALLEAAAQTSQCGCVIADLSSGWSEAAEAAWHRSDVILWVGTEEPSCRKKEEVWLRQMPGWSGNGSLRGKTMFISNKRLDIDGSFTNRGLPIPLPYVPEWKQGGEVKDPLFQRQINRLTEELWNRCLKR